MTAEEAKKMYYDNQTLYEVLGLPRYGKIEDGPYSGISISMDRIKKARDRLIWGLDGFDTVPTWDRPRIENAYAILSDPEKRKEYDEFLAKGKVEEQQPVQAEPVQAETVQAEPVQEEPVQEEPVQEEPVQEESVQAELVQAEPVQEELVQAEPVQAEPVQEEPVQAEPVQEEPKISVTDKKQAIEFDKTELERRNFNKKQRMKRAAVILGSTVLFGLPGTIISAMIVKKNSKFALQKTSKKGIIKSVKSAESELIQQYNEKLASEISDLLNKPLRSDMDNYKLEIAKLRYHNNLELLNARIKLKESELDQLGMKAHNALHLLALKGRLKADVLRLELMKKIAERKVNVIENYTPTKSNDKLAELNEEIEEKNEELSDSTLSKGKRDRKMLKIRKLNQQRLATIKSMSLKTNGISRSQLFLATINSIGNKNVEVEEVEAVEEEQIKLSK